MWEESGSPPWVVLGARGLGFIVGMNGRLVFTGEVRITGSIPVEQFAFVVEGIWIAGPGSFLALLPRRWRAGRYAAGPTGPFLRFCRFLQQDPDCLTHHLGDGLADGLGNGLAHLLVQAVQGMVQPFDVKSQRVSKGNKN
jgi:hypothetical protein